MPTKKSLFTEQQSFSFSSLLLSLWILSCSSRCVIGMVTLSPVMVAPVCHVGDPLQITCTASVEFIRWSLSLVNEQGTTEEITGNINSRDSSQQLTQREVNSTMFTFTRSSAEDASPLISTLSIDSVSIGLNGTVVHCIEVGDSMSSVSTTIHIAEVGYNQYTLTLQITSEEHSADNVTVTVGWAQQFGVTYAVRVLPLVPITFNGSTSCQLTISYNTEYTFSVQAIGPYSTCGVNPTSSTSTTLKYVNCGYPNLLPRVGNDSVPRIAANDDIPLEGTNINFSCPPGSVLASSNSATCAENGRWELELIGLTCAKSIVTMHTAAAVCDNPLHDRVSATDSDTIKVMGYTDPVMEGTIVTFECPPQHILIGPNTTTCMGNGEWEPDPMEVECKGTGHSKSEESGSPDIVLVVALSATVAAFLVISLLMFVAGFFCGRYFKQKYKGPSKMIPDPLIAANKTPDPPIANPPAVPLYEDVNRLTCVMKHWSEEQGPELKENVSYRPSKSMY